MTAQKGPYKMQNPEVRSSRNQNFGNNMEALQNAKPGSFLFHEKMVLVQNVWPSRTLAYKILVQTCFVPNPG